MRVYRPPLPPRRSCGNVRLPALSAPAAALPALNGPPACAQTAARRASKPTSFRRTRPPSRCGPTSRPFFAGSGLTRLCARAAGRAVDHRAAQGGERSGGERGAGWTTVGAVDTSARGDGRQHTHGDPRGGRPRGTPLSPPLRSIRHPCLLSSSLHKADCARLSADAVGVGGSVSGREGGLGCAGG